MQSNLLALLANYQLKTIDIALTDGALLPVSVIGSGKPVILLHAYGMDAREFLPFILPAALTRIWRCKRYRSQPV